MKTQNASNHAQYVKGFQGILFILLLLFLGGSISFLIHASPAQLYPATLFVLLAVTLMVMAWYVRIVSLTSSRSGHSGRGAVAVFYNYAKDLT